MRILVTGASGFLGGRVAEGLVARGHQVRALIRERGRALPPGVEPVVGDVTEADRVREAAEGCEALVHAAALVSAWARDRSRFEQVNVQGTRHVLAAAREVGAKLLYVSSFIALGPSDGGVLDETSPRADHPFHNDYERTKTLADRAVRSVSPAAQHVVRLYPGVVYGPGRLTAGNHVVGLLLQHARGKLPGLLGRGDRRQSFTYVDDVVEGVVSALDAASAGAGYVLGGDNRTVLDLFEAFERAAGVPVPRRRIPFAVAGLIGRAQRWRADLLHIEPELTDEVVAIYRHEWCLRSDRAGRELGYRVTSLEDGMARTVAWLRASGELAA